MDADSNHGCHERIMLLCVYEHAVQAVIIEDAVIDTFRGGALIINFLISICAAGNVGVKRISHSGRVLTTLPYLESVQEFLHLEQCSFP